MGKRIGAGKGGRYKEKGGGCDVNSFFEESTENEKIKAIYGNYCLWAWLKYWWIDTENQVTLMLTDKTYHDYDYTEPKPKRKTTAADREIMSDDKVAAILGRAINPTTGRMLREETPIGSSASERAEWIQREMRKDMGLPELSPNKGN